MHNASVPHALADTLHVQPERVLPRPTDVSRAVMVVELMPSSSMSERSAQTLSVQAVAALSGQSATALTSRLPNSAFIDRNCLRDKGPVSALVNGPMSTSVAERDVSDDTGGGRLPMGAVVAVGSVGVLLVLVAIGCLVARRCRNAASVSVTPGMPGAPADSEALARLRKKYQCQLVQAEAAALLVGEPIEPTM